jgi:hypothetical protein
MDDQATTTGLMKAASDLPGPVIGASLACYQAYLARRWGVAQVMVRSKPSHIPECKIMPLMPSNIRDEVRDVLARASRGKGDETTFLTAYQILARLPEAIRARLIDERQLGGKGTGVHYAAASVVSDAAEQIQGVEVRYLDTRQLTIHVAGQLVEPGYQVCGLYRLRS